MKESPTLKQPWITLLVLTMVSVVAFLLLPDHLAVQIALSMAFVSGLWKSQINPDAAPHYLRISLLFFLPLLLVFFIHPPALFPIHLGCLLLTGFYSGWWIGKLPDDLRWSHFLVFGLISLLGSVYYSYLDNVDWAVYGRAIIFLLAGLAIHKGKYPFWVRQLFLLPAVLVALISAIPDPGEVGWLIFGVLPLVSILAFNLPLLRKVQYGRFIFLATTGAFFVVITLCVFWIFPPLIYSSYNSFPETEVPSFQLQKLREEGEISNKSLLGQVYFMDCWSTRCGACMLEFPYVVEIKEHFAGNPDVQFLAVSSKKFNSREQILKAERYLAFDIEQYYDSSGIFFDSLELDGVPVCFLVDKKGMIRYRKPGFGKRDGLFFKEDVIQRIEGLLAE